MHVRQQIRDYVSTLVTGLTTTAGRVYPSRVYPLAAGGLPGLCVYTGAEDISDEDAVAGLQIRSLQITIDCIDKLIAGADDQLDQMAAEIEIALFADQYFGGLVHAFDLSNVEIEIITTTEKPVGIAHHIFTAQYITAIGDPETAL